MDKQLLISALELEPHIEGGYFRRTYQSPILTEPLSEPAPGEQRHCLSSIYYCLTDDSPVGHFHRNTSDILHYWQAGSALNYWLIDQQGQLSIVKLGPNLANGEQLQLLVPGGVWKATELSDGEYGLLSEAVCPGFEYTDMTLASAKQMQADYPQHWPRIAHLCKT